MRLLDDFLRTGVLTQTEYEDAKRKAFQSEAQKTGNGNASSSNSNNPVSSYNNAAYPTQTSAAQRQPPAQNINTGADAQIAQLNQFLAQGVLNQAEYEDAKQKVLQDYGVSQVQVTLPRGVVAGQNMTVEHNGKFYSVVSTLR